MKIQTLLLDHSEQLNLPSCIWRATFLCLVWIWDHCGIPKASARSFWAAKASIIDLKIDVSLFIRTDGLSNSATWGKWLMEKNEKHIMPISLFQFFFKVHKTTLMPHFIHKHLKSNSFFLYLLQVIILLFNGLTVFSVWHEIQCKQIFIGLLVSLL